MQPIPCATLLYHASHCPEATAPHLLLLLQIKPADRQKRNLLYKLATSPSDAAVRLSTNKVPLIPGSDLLRIQVNLEYNWRTQAREIFWKCAHPLVIQQTLGWPSVHQTAYTTTMCCDLRCHTGPETWCCVLPCLPATPAKPACTAAVHASNSRQGAWVDCIHTVSSCNMAPPL